MDQPKIISFDVEGTLVSHGFSETLWHEAIPLSYARKYNIDLVQARKITTEEFEKAGSHRMEWYDVGYWFRRFQLGDPDQVIRSCRDKIYYYPEVKSVLSSIAARYELVVSSTVPLYLLYHLLGRIKSYFTHVFSSTTQYSQLKTTYFYRQICQVLDIEPAYVVHVGDNWNTDYLNPRKIGMNAFYLDREGGSEESCLRDLTQLETILSSGTILRERTVAVQRKCHPKCSVNLSPPINM
jgi:HAD superfamily hydrolase (TIGR01549 family)